jgi:hypothetical protein
MFSAGYEPTCRRPPAETPGPDLWLRRTMTLPHMSSAFLNIIFHFRTGTPGHESTRCPSTSTRRRFQPADATHSSHKGPQLQNRQHQMPVVGLEAWFAQIPPVTRTWLALSVLTSVAVVRPVCLLFSPRRSLQIVIEILLTTMRFYTYVLCLSHGSNVN